MVWAKNGLGQKGKIMRKNLFNRAVCRIPMDVQFFAEADGVGMENSQGAGGSGETAGTKNQENTTTETTEQKKSFDDILSDTEYQAEFDRRIQKALETQKSKLEVLFDDKVSEAEKLAKMNEKEKAQYLQKKQEKELSDREANITKRELMAEAKNSLAEKKLPAGLAEILNYTNADTCKSSIEVVEKAFQAAVESEVQERLKGSEPPKKATQGNNEEALQKQVEALMRGY